jgi:ribokinase
VRVAVVGHVEWVEFARVESVPAAGDIVHAQETWEQPGGGGAVAALQLARLAGACSLFTAVGGDALGGRMRKELGVLGISVHAEARETERQRRAVTFVDDRGERTIAVFGPKLRPRADDRLPWEALAECDAVYFASGDAGALRLARRARLLVATSRELATIREAGVELDAVVGSGDDDRERLRPGELDPPPRLVVSTAGALGGWAQPGGPYTAAAPPGPVEDAYGCGDCFAAGLAYALGTGLATADALAFAARCGAAALTGRGVHAAAVPLEVPT